MEGSTIKKPKRRSVGEEVAHPLSLTAIARFTQTQVWDAAIHNPQIVHTLLHKLNHKQGCLFQYSGKQRSWIVAPYDL